MSKVKNITIEERDNAIALINKLGLELTETNIQYYVRMARDSKKHRAEKEKLNLDSPIAESLDVNSANKTVWISKLGMLTSLGAVIITFVRSGFGFTIWWYLVLIILASLTLLFLGIILIHKEKRLDTDAAYVVKIAAYIGIALIAILYLWGPLNSNYERSGSSDNFVYDNTSTSPTINQDTKPRKCLDCGKDISDLHPSFDRCWDCDNHRNALKEFNENLKKANSPYADYSTAY